jgi:hypothetical protein
MNNQLIKIGSGNQLIENDYLNELFHHYETCKVPAVKTMIHTAISVIEALRRGELPPELPVMEVSEDSMAAVQEYVRDKYPTDQEAGLALFTELAEPLEEIDYLLRHLRDELIGSFSMYGYVSSPFVRDLATYTAGQPVLELMAGHGYLSAGLRAIDSAQTVWATDNEDWRDQPDLAAAEPVTAITVMDAISALDKYGEQVSTVLMSWAPDTTEADVQVLDYIRNNADRFDFDFIVIGEKFGATNSEKFWRMAHLTEIAALNAHHRSFDLIDERVYLVE